MTTYSCTSRFCNCGVSENGCSCGKKECCDCCSCCCCCGCKHCHHHHHEHEHGRNEVVCYPVMVESFSCCSCWNRC